MTDEWNQKLNFVNCGK